MRPLYAWARVSKGELRSVADLGDERDEVIAYLNRPAGDRCVRVKITEVKSTKQRKATPRVE